MVPITWSLKKAQWRLTGIPSTGTMLSKYLLLFLCFGFSRTSSLQIQLNAKLELSRRQWIATSVPALISPLSSHADDTLLSPTVQTLSSVRPVRPIRAIKDPETYSGLVYTPPTPNNNDNNNNEKLPLIVFLHGAGINERDVWNLADLSGEHAGLLPSLLASGQAPREVMDHFAVLMPYSHHKPSFYNEPRTKILQFIDWAMEHEFHHNQRTIDPQRIFLFGFSDGATLGIELMTTRRFAAAIICSYGFTGKLPKLALQRLTNIPMWVFHSQDDIIFPVQCSDALVESLQQVNTNTNIIRYSRFITDPEDIGGAIQGHTTGLTASKAPQVYQWLLALK